MANLKDLQEQQVQNDAVTGEETNEETNETKTKDPMSYGTIQEEQTDPEEELNEAVNGVSIGAWSDYAKQWRNELWEREDALREEQQQRDDTAYTRMVADMERAGINPNLVQGTPNYGTNAQATSTTDSGLNATIDELLTKETNKLTEAWHEVYKQMQELGYETSTANNTTTNVFGLIRSLVGVVGTIIGGLI